jgi:aminoglycoside phosphotransferase (APT) family kinase protein
MRRMKMHEGQVDVDSDVVGRLLEAQFPDLAESRIEPVRSTGTVNALFRVGDSPCARLPLVERWATDIERELEWLSWLGSQLSMRVPAPVAAGQPTDIYPSRGPCTDGSRAARIQTS